MWDMLTHKYKCYQDLVKTGNVCPLIVMAASVYEPNLFIVLSPCKCYVAIGNQRAVSQI